MSSIEFQSDASLLQLVRQFTARFLQYPHVKSPRTEVLEENRTFLTPKPSPHAPLPVVGVALRLTYDGMGVVLFTPETVDLTQTFRDRFDQSGIVRTHYSGEFTLAAIGGDSLGYGVSGGVTGTLGCIAENTARDEYVLSCNHVIAYENKGS